MADIAISSACAPQIEGESDWIVDALQNDADGINWRIWARLAEDFKEEFARKYLGRPEPSFWSEI